MAIWKRLPKPNPEKEAALQEQLSKEKLSCKDKLAMMISAFFVLFVPTVLVLLVFVALILIFFALF